MQTYIKLLCSTPHLRTASKVLILWLKVLFSLALDSFVLGRRQDLQYFQLGVDNIMATHLQVMVVGGGGREHALAWRLNQSPSVDYVYVIPGNAGITRMGTSVSAIDNVDLEDFPSLVALAQRLKIDLVVIGPDSVIVGGIRECFDEGGCITQIDVHD